MTRDPVCGMNVDEQKVGAKTQYQRTTYYFCSAGCQKAFAAEPAKYAMPPAAGQQHGDGKRHGR